MLAGVAELHAEAVLDIRVAHGPVDGAAARHPKEVVDGINEVDGPVSGEESLVPLLSDAPVVLHVGVVLGKVAPRVHDELYPRNIDGYAMLYRVSYVVADLGWADKDFKSSLG